jgi:hypothetical protein
MPTAYSFRTKPISRATATAVTTSGEKFAVPATTIQARVARIKTSAAAYVGTGNSGTIPAAADTNTVYHESGVEDYVLNNGAQNTYIYVYSQSATVDVFISFLG